MNKRSLVNISTTLIIVLILIFTGPASAVKIKMSTPSGQYYDDQTVDFTVEIQFKTNDLIPIQNINITGLPKGDLSFRPDGTIISGDTGYDVTRISSAFYGYGYGYGYDQNPGLGYGYGYNFDSGYNFGYEYGYGYGYGYGYENGNLASELIYEIKIGDLESDTYSGTAEISVETGNSDKPSFSASQSYSFDIISREKESEREREKSSSSNRNKLIRLGLLPDEKNESIESNKKFEPDFSVSSQAGSEGMEQTEESIEDKAIPGFEVIIGILGILIAIYVRRKKPGF